MAAYDGASWADKAKSDKPDLILLDIVMPKMDGYEVFKMLKADPNTEKIPIVVFTASQVWNLQDKCRKLGITNFIMKPFESKELVSMVNIILSEKKR